MRVILLYVVKLKGGVFLMFEERREVVICIIIRGVNGESVYTLDWYYVC